MRTQRILRGSGGLAAVWLAVGVGLAVTGNVLRAHAATEVPMPAAVQDNMDVELEYTLTVDGKVVDSTDGQQPLHYVHGQGQIIPGLERELAGLHVGDSKEVTVKPEDGYGQVDPAAVVEVQKAQLPPDITPAVGMTLRGASPDGHAFRATIKEVKDQTVVLDLNHALAGKTLSFKVKVVGTTPAPH